MLKNKELRLPVRPLGVRVIGAELVLALSFSCAEMGTADPTAL